MTGEEQNFFERLAALEDTPEGLAAFDQFISRPLDLTAPEFFASLYTALIDRMLAWLELPSGPGAALREWRPLYRMGSVIDPYYHTEAQIARELARCPPMGEAQRERLGAVLQGYFRLRREGFPAGFPSPLISVAECGRWSALFPAEFAWKSMEILQAVGLYAVGNQAGARACKRFAEGVFEPDLAGDSLQQWQTACAGGRGQGRKSEDGGAFAQRRDFLAAAFAGEFASLGLAGWCAAVPRCGACPLAQACRWAARPTKESAESAEILGRVQQGRLAHLSSAQLMQAVLDLDKPAGEAIEAGLRDIPLRRLAAKSRPEMEECLRGTGVTPERLEGLFELGKRFGEERLLPGAPLLTGREVFNHFRMRLRDFKQERFLVILLDAHRRYLGDVMVSQGTLSNSPVHPRDVFSHAVREQAAFVMIAHNHPSGDPTPSKDDLNVTVRLMEAGKMIGIPLVDHVIIAGDEYISFAERDLM